MASGWEGRPSFDWEKAHARLEQLRRALESGWQRPPEEVARILHERARALARPPVETAPPAEVEELLVFAIGEERYAVDVAHIVETIPLRGLTPVPCTPAFVAGVALHRGRALPVLDLRPLLGLAAPGPAASAQVVAVEAGGMSFGILAGAVAGVTGVLTSDVMPPPAGRESEARSFVRGLTRDAVAVLDVEALAADPRIVVDEEVR